MGVQEQPMMERLEELKMDGVVAREEVGMIDGLGRTGGRAEVETREADVSAGLASRGRVISPTSPGVGPVVASCS